MTNVSSEGTAEPEFQALSGIESGDEQSPLTDRKATDRDRALQQATLVLDQEFAVRWVTTMQFLVERELPHDEFIFVKMAELKQWTKDRKREQHNTGYAFNPARRKRRLVERDVRKQLAKTVAHMKAFDLVHPEFAAAVNERRQRVIRRITRFIDPTEPINADHPESMPPVPEDIETETKGPVVRSLDDVDTFVASMIATDMHVVDLARVTDAEILDYYVKTVGLANDDAQQYVAALNNPRR